jgi:hypothetical protein
MSLNLMVVSPLSYLFGTSFCPVLTHCESMSLAHTHTLTLSLIRSPSLSLTHTHTHFVTLCVEATFEIFIFPFLSSSSFLSDLLRNNLVLWWLSCECTQQTQMFLYLFKIFFSQLTSFIFTHYPSLPLSLSLSLSLTSFYSLITFSFIL